MADWFAHRLDAEEIAADRIRRTGMIHVVRMAHTRGGFLVIPLKKPVLRTSLKEITR